MIIVDTNIVSELMRENAGAVAAWLRDLDDRELFTTAITRAEIRYGIARLPSGSRRSSFEADADAFFGEIIDRTLGFDVAAADRYGEVAAIRRRLGRPISIPDAQIAAIALVHRATVATRNVRDFEGVGLKLVDPFTWEATP